MKNKKYKKLIKLIKKQDNYKKYKCFFHHPVTRFTFSYIITYFEPNELSEQQIKDIIDLENKLTTSSSIKNFKNVFSQITRFVPLKYKKVNWEEYGVYFYYLWQTSRFHYDKKKKISNIYITNNQIYLNSVKRNTYYKWMESVKKYDLHFNKIILYLKQKGL